MVAAIAISVLALAHCHCHNFPRIQGKCSGFFMTASTTFFANIDTALGGKTKIKMLHSNNSHGASFKSDFTIALYYTSIRLINIDIGYSKILNQNGSNNSKICTCLGSLLLPQFPKDPRHM
jgi:hypothetical protein